MWHPDLSEDEAVAMMEAGIAEIKKRLVVAPPHYMIKVVDKNGVREVKKV
jgi:20S proteasome subunit beta 4